MAKKKMVYNICSLFLVLEVIAISTFCQGVSNCTIPLAVKLGYFGCKESTARVCFIGKGFPTEYACPESGNNRIAQDQSSKEGGIKSFNQVAVWYTPLPPARHAVWLSHGGVHLFGLPVLAPVAYVPITASNRLTRW